MSADDESRDRAGGRRGAAAGDGDRSTCTPCRGTGKVTSALSGSEHVVSCGGTGRFAPGRDAQESPAEQDTRGDLAAPESSAEGDGPEHDSQ